MFGLVRLKHAKLTLENSNANYVFIIIIILMVKICLTHFDLRK